MPLSVQIDSESISGIQYLLVVFGTILVSRGAAFKARDIVVRLIGRRSEDHSLDSCPVRIPHGDADDVDWLTRHQPIASLDAHSFLYVIWV